MYSFFKNMSQLPAGALCIAGALHVASSSAHAQITANGALEPVQTVVVGSYVSGIIEGVTCEVNATVTKGQVCAKIDPRRFQKAVDQARAAVETAQAQLVLSQAVYAQALATYERNKALFEKGVVSKSVYEAVTSAYEQAKAQIDLGKANIDLRKAEQGAAELNLSYTDIIAPIDGIVLTRKVETGETVAATLQSPTLFVMASGLKKLRLTANVKEGDVVNVKLGDSGVCTAKALPRKTFNARVTQVRNDPETINGEVYYKVVLEVDNQDLILKPGMSVSVRIATS